MVGKQALLASCLILGAQSQTPEKTFYFSHIQTPQATQEAANAIRSIGDIRDVTPDAPKHSVTVSGTEEQLAIAGWLAAELDNPAAPPATRDLPFSDPRAPLAQVFFLRHLSSAVELQEVVNAVRSVTDIQRCFPMNQQKAIVMRAMPEQIKAADWILGVLDRPADAAPGEPQEYRLPEGVLDARSGLLVRAAPITHITTPQGIQELVNGTRSMADLQRFFPIQSRRFVLMRGTDEQLAVAKWLMQQFDGPAGTGTKEYRMGLPGSEIVQVSYVNAGTPASLKETAVEIQKVTRMQHVFPFTSGAIAMRGSAAQLSEAAAVIQSKSAKPSR
jgi:hypothetical protein